MIIECAFGSSNYQINFLNPLVKPIFTNGKDLFDIQVSSQRLKGIIARNPLKETKESLIPTARRELRGTGKFTENISKVKLGRAMVEERLQNYGYVWG